MLGVIDLSRDALLPGAMTDTGMHKTKRAVSSGTTRLEMVEAVERLYLFVATPKSHQAGDRQGDQREAAWLWDGSIFKLHVIEVGLDRTVGNARADSDV